MSEHGQGSPGLGPDEGDSASDRPSSAPPYGTPPDRPYGPPGYGPVPPPPGYGPVPPPPGYGPAPPPPGYGPAAPYGAAPYGVPAVPGTLASMARRLGARLIDGVIAGVVLSILGAVVIGGASRSITVDANGSVTSGGGVLAGAIFGYFALVLVYSLAYEVVLIALNGATLGKMAVGIKVVREADGGLPGWGPSVLRWLIPGVSAVICGLITLVIYLSPFWDSTGRQQGWHDKVAHTLVVNAR